MKIVEITITAEVPGHDPELAHEAITHAKDVAHAVVETLSKLGLVHAHQQRRIVTKKERKAPGDASAA